VSVEEVRAHEHTPTCPNCGYTTGDHDGMKPTALHTAWDEKFDDEETPDEATGSEGGDPAP
jgi:hypothetical protein